MVVARGCCRSRFGSCRRLLTAAAHALSAVLLCVAPAVAQNSSKKIRPEPSALAAKAGSAVDWRADLATALADAKSSGRPVFWYVPSLSRSPMDRKPVIDRYMMAGPFSWPSTVQLLNVSYVPLKHVPSRAEMKAYGLAPRQFIEPGYVILNASDGAEAARLDRITTFQRDWFEAPLRAAVAGAAKKGTAKDASTSAASWAGEAEFRRGALALFASKDLDVAREAWSGLLEKFPDSPLSWKAAAELEGHGPLDAGFEILGALPAAVLRDATARRDTVGTQAPAGVYSEDDFWRLGAQQLRSMQRPNGGIEDSRYDFGGTDSLPNVYVATTAVAGMALTEARWKLRAGGASGPGKASGPGREGDTPVLMDHLRSFFDYVADDSHLNPEDTDELVWAHLYRLRFAALLLRQDAPKIDEDWETQALDLRDRATVALHSMQHEGGSWSHEYRNPFVTASVLLALADARRAGAAIDASVVERGIKALLSCRTTEGAISYGQPRGNRGPRASIQAAIGRMALAECALEVWGVAGEASDSRQKELCAALDASFEHHALLEEIRKYDDHANRHGHGGFFFWYDMRARSEAITLVKDTKRRLGFAKQQRDLIVSLPEIDGCFVDSHELGRSYGTAMALLSLRLLDDLE